MGKGQLMAGPWEQYASESGPWTAYAPTSAPAAERGVTDKLLGLTGPRYQTWPEKMVRGAVSGAALPGDVVQGKVDPTSEEGIARTTSLAALLSPVNPAIRAGDRIIPGAAQAFSGREKAVVPTTQELKVAGVADIKAAKNSGLDIRGDAVSDYSRKIQQELFDSGVHPVRAKDTYAVLKELENAPPDSIFTPANLQTLREHLGSIAQNFNPNAAKDQLAASRAIKQLDAFLPSIAEKDVLAGSPAATHKLFETGRGNYAAAMRSNDITGVLDRANTGILDRSLARAQASHSGRNIDNTIRSKVTSILEKPKEVAGYTDAELVALEGASEGGRPRNAARTIGNLLGGGGGLGSTVLAATGAIPGAMYGGTTGAVVGATPAIAGAAARTVANALAKRDLRKVDELLRQRSPLYEQRSAEAPMSVVTPEGRAAVIRALLLSQQQ